MDEKKDYCYELWGNDTFSNESYQCGVYRHYSSARRAMKRRIADSLETQSEGMRDTYRIIKTSVEKHNREVNAWRERIDAVHERIKQDEDFAETILPDLECFMKQCTKSVGTYVFPLPETSKETCIKTIKVIFEKVYRGRVKHKFTIAITAKDQKYSGTTQVDYAFGRLEEVVREILENDYIEQLRKLIDKEIQRHYFKYL